MNASNQMEDDNEAIVNPMGKNDRAKKGTRKEYEDVGSMILQIGGRTEGSVASDVSGLTDGDLFRLDFPNSSNTLNSRNYRSVVRAPEPPATSGGRSKLTDINSETTATATTVSSTRDEVSLKKKRSVSFCEVQIRNYERILEFNPSVTSGPAVGIGWNYSPDEDESIPLETFEDTREYHRRTNSKDLTLSRMEREDMLRSLGYTQKEIAGSVRTILRLKNQRKQTIQNLHASSMEEFVEKASRKVKRVLFFPMNKRKIKNVYPSLDSSHERKPSLQVITA